MLVGGEQKKSDRHMRVNACFVLIFVGVVFCKSAG